MIRLLILTHNTKLSGAELLLARTLELRDPHQFDVHVAIPDAGPLASRLSAIPGVHVHIVSTSASLTQLKKRGGVSQYAGWLSAPLHLIRLIQRLRQLIGRERIDLVLCSSIKSDVYGSVAARMSGRPCAWYIHDFVDEHYFPGWLRRVIGAAGRRIPICVFTDSAAALDALVRIGLPRERMQVAYPPALIRGNLAATDVRRELGVPIDTRLVTLIGRFAPPKGQREFVRAAALIAKRFPDVRFLLVGDSMFGGSDDSYRDEVVSLLRQPDIQGHVFWLGARPDADAILSQSTIAVMNSLWPEGFGYVAAEAMIAGVPIVGTALGGTAELLIHDRTALVVQPGDLEGLAEAIATLLDDPDRGRRLAAAAQAHVPTVQSDDCVRRFWLRLEQSFRQTTI